jgi:hypothetical protein
MSATSGRMLNRIGSPLSPNPPLTIKVVAS